MTTPWRILVISFPTMGINPDQPTMFVSSDDITFVDWFANTWNAPERTP